MSICANKLELVKEIMPKIALYLMLGSIMGFLMFHKIFYYFGSPFTGEMPTWFLILSLVAMGVVCGYLYPTITNVLAMTFILPIVGAFFSFILLVSPVFSPDIITMELPSLFVILAKYMVPLLFMTFIIMLCTGFISVYLFESAE